MSDLMKYWPNPSILAALRRRETAGDGRAQGKTYTLLFFIAAEGFESPMPGAQGMMTGTTAGMRPEGYADIGKKLAGHLLDGVEWHQFPER